MELVEGPTLAERIAQGPVSLEEALAIAKQIADALEAAHEKGIVHRDHRLEDAARATSIAHEIAVERYENHRAAHELKVMTAGSGFPE
jgi:serine/threonine protein kinase